jgi:NADH-quinone oxidoreductase subunit H
MGLSVVSLFMLMGDPALVSKLSTTWQNFLAGTSSLNLGRIVAYQSQSVFDWLIFKQPIAFVIFLVAAFAETNRLPFDMAESETELVGGYHTEYSSMKFGLFFLGEYAAMIAASALMVTLFLGGWTLPIGGLNEPATSMAVGVAQIAIFIAKLLGFMVVFIWVRWMLPRFRYDQLMDLGWRRFIPVALANILITALVLWWRAR